MGKRWSVSVLHRFQRRRWLAPHQPQRGGDRSRGDRVRSVAPDPWAGAARARRPNFAPPTAPEATPAGRRSCVLPGFCQPPRYQPACTPRARQARDRDRARSRSGILLVRFSRYPPDHRTTERLHDVRVAVGWRSREFAADLNTCQSFGSACPSNCARLFHRGAARSDSLGKLAPVSQ